VASCLISRPVPAQVVDTTLWGTDGTVSAIARSGNTLYIGGALGEVGPNTGGGIPLSACTGTPASPFPKVAGYVGSAVPDGHGGWFISGDFTAVGGLSRASLAHILYDGSVAPWAPSHDAYDVGRLALSESTLYVAGQFNVMDGQPRARLAAFDAATGDLLPWDPSPSGDIGPYVGPDVPAMVVRGDTVFVGGNFTQIGGQPRVGLAALDGRTGQALPWYPGASNNLVSALALKDDALYLAGYFTQFAGRTRNRAAAVDVSTGAVLPWNPDVTGPDDPYVGSPRVGALAVSESTVYLGGQFLGVGGEARNALAAVDADTGGVLPWNPSPAHTYTYPYPYVRSLAVQGDTIYVGGNFDTIGGQDRSSLAAIDANTGAATSWNPRPDYDHDVVALAVSGGVVYAGGTFPTLGPWKFRSCLAALDLTTGAVKDWNPDPNGLVVNSMVVSGGTVYVGGDFTLIGGQSRSGIAALDTLTGAATTWNPAADGSVTSLLLSDGNLYVGGGFWNIGGQPRRYAAALDTATGLATAWNANVEDWVFSMANSESTLYLGGLFRSVGGQPRMFFAAVDLATGGVRPWRVDADGVPNALAVSGTTVYAGGDFQTINDQSRNCLAALDAGTGMLMPWNPAISGWVASSPPVVHALAVHGRTIFAGGDFYTVGGLARPCLAALDDSLGTAKNWDPLADYPVWSLTISGNDLYAGGSFGSVCLTPAHGFAALSIPEDPVARPPAFALAQNFPNPARAATTVRFTLPTAAVATLALYDVQGRRVAMPFGQLLLQPGQHDVVLRLDGLKSGVYLYRLEAGGKIATRKLLVVR